MSCLIITHPGEGRHVLLVYYSPWEGKAFSSSILSILGKEGMFCLFITHPGEGRHVLHHVLEEVIEDWHLLLVILSQIVIYFQDEDYFKRRRESGAETNKKKGKSQKKKILKKWPIIIKVS